MRSEERWSGEHVTDMKYTSLPRRCIEALGMVQSIRGTVALLPQVAQQVHVIALFSLEVSVKKCTRRSRV